MSDGDGSRKSPSVAMGREETEPGDFVERARQEMLAHMPPFRDEHGNVISRHEAMRQADAVLGPEPDVVTVDRKLLEEALYEAIGQIEALAICDERHACRECGALMERKNNGFNFTDWVGEHTQYCRLMRVLGLLRSAEKAL